MDKFSAIVENTRKVFDARTAARDQALVQARQLTRLCAHTIRAIHRLETDSAHELLTEAKTLVQQMQKDLEKFPDLYLRFYPGCDQRILRAV